MLKCYMKFTYNAFWPLFLELFAKTLTKPTFDVHIQTKMFHIFGVISVYFIFIKIIDFQMYDPVSRKN